MKKSMRLIRLYGGCYTVIDEISMAMIAYIQHICSDKQDVFRKWLKSFKNYDIIEIS